MILLFHISVALLGILQATYALFVPSRRKLHIVSGLVVATLASGTYLVWHSHASIISACTSGLLYVGGVSALSMAAYYRLAKEKARS